MQTLRTTVAVVTESAVGPIQVRDARTMVSRHVSAKRTPIAARWSGPTSVVILPVNVWVVVVITSVAREKIVAIVRRTALVIQPPQFVMLRQINASGSVEMVPATRVSPATPVHPSVVLVKAAVVWPMRRLVVSTRTPWIVWVRCPRVV